jgi:CoA-dependent NAD(P)H sulfur oxidoreductase
LASGLQQNPIMKRLIVIGADAAGMSAASRARRLDPELGITAFERGRYTSYAACGLPYLIGGVIPEAADLVARRPEDFARQDIDVRIRHEVLSIDPAARRVVVRDLESGQSQDEPYDELLIATGARPIVPDLPGLDLPGVHVLKRIEDAIAIAEAVPSAKRALIVGGGYIGLEVAEALVARKVSTVIVEGLDRLLPTVDRPLSELALEEVRAAGVEVHLSTKVEGIAESSGALTVSTSAGPIEADLVVVSVGVRPNAELAEAAGVALGVRGAIITDERMHTNVDGIWAAGDCCQATHRVTGEPVWIPLGDTANRMGRVAGTNLGGGSDRFTGVTGTSVTKVFERGFARTGLSRDEAAAAGLEVQTVHVDAKDRAHFMPGARPIRVLLNFEPQSGRLLGGQIAGYGDAIKRIDGLAVAVTAGWTLDDLRHADLGYAPPYSPVWDPVLVAANVASGR